MPSYVLPLHLKQTFPPIIWIFNVDGIESKLPFKIFSTLPYMFIIHILFMSDRSLFSHKSFRAITQSSTPQSKYPVLH